ncbi:MAG: hypothetical protein KF789_11155 [Bdellovibrionaceae bacterium]|nr:hypothetical protein [Pseudobdellovibrionaceae bacterium]
MKYLALILKALVVFNNDQSEIEILKEREFRPGKRGQRTVGRIETFRVIGF